MKVAFSLLLLVAFANAGPISPDARRQPIAAEKPTLIVGSSQVDSKSSGKVTLHLDQRSQIGQEVGGSVLSEKRVEQPKPAIVPVPVVPVTKVAEEIPKRPVPVQVVEQPAKQEPVLTGRNQVASPAKPVGSEKSEPIIPPVKNELSARNEAPVQSPVVQQVAAPAKLPINEKVLEPVVAKPLPVVQETLVPVLISQPVAQVVPQVPVVVVQPVAQVPQAIVIPEVVPVIPEQVRVVEPAVEIRSPQVPAGQPVQSQSNQPEIVLPAKPSLDKKVVSLDSRNNEVKQEKLVVVDPKQKQAESQARNLKVEQVKAPVVVSSVQKQVPLVEVHKTEEQKPQPVVASQGSKLEGKHATVPVTKPEVPVVQAQPVKPLVVVAEQTVPVVVTPEQSVRHEPVLSQVPQVVSQVGKQVVKPVVEQLSSVQTAVVPKSAVVPPVVQESSLKHTQLTQQGVKPVLASQPEQSNQVPLVTQAVVSESAKVQPLPVEKAH